MFVLQNIPRYNILKKSFWKTLNKLLRTIFANPRFKLPENLPISLVVRRGKELFTFFHDEKLQHETSIDACVRGGARARTPFRMHSVVGREKGVVLPLPFLPPNFSNILKSFYSSQNYLHLHLCMRSVRGR